MVDTRPMPKRSRDEVQSMHRLCQSIDELAAEATPWHVASRCVSAMAEALEARAVVIHQHDASRDEIRSIGVHGPNSGDLLGTTMKADDDFVVTAVLTNETPLTMRLDGALPRFLSDRHRLLGTSRSLVAFPVVASGRCLAIIEVLDASEGREPRVAEACELVARRLVSALDARKRQPRAADTRAEDTLTVFPKRTAALLPSVFTRSAR
jgi:hypothetical protein